MASVEKRENVGKRERKVEEAGTLECNESITRRITAAVSNKLSRRPKASASTSTESIKVSKSTSPKNQRQTPTGRARFMPFIDISNDEASYPRYYTMRFNE